MAGAGLGAARGGLLALGIGGSGVTAVGAPTGGGAGSAGGSRLGAGITGGSLGVGAALAVESAGD